MRIFLLNILLLYVFLDHAYDLPLTKLDHLAIDGYLAGLYTGTVLLDYLKNHSHQKAGRNAGHPSDDDYSGNRGVQ